MARVDLVAALADAVSDRRRVSTESGALERHAQDLSHHPAHPPDVVVFAKDKWEVQRVLRFANEHSIPVVPFGLGTSLEGHVIPVEGGISLDLSLMNEILEVRPDDFLAWAQAGVTRVQLDERLRRDGMFFPVDPGVDASLGGMTATNASGTSAVRYGAMRHNVLGLEVALPNGAIIATGSKAVKSSAGLNLTALFTGSEGTLGVITEVTVKIYRLPAFTIAGRASFETVDSAVRAATRLTQTGMAVARVELLDDATIRAVNAYKGTSYTDGPTLFLEFSGSEASVRDDVRLAKEIFRADNCIEFQVDEDREAREALWGARHEAAFAILATAPGKKLMSTDVCVPVSCLADAIEDARRVMDAHDFGGMLLGHVGDGNYHGSFPVDADDEEELARAERVNSEIVRYALERGGTCTGEHGVGVGKADYLYEEHGDAVELMRGIKRAADPRGIMNPGKMLPSRAVSPAAPAAIGR